MNKLVILGNGFDLAHGLPTSYSHFLNDFWKNLKIEEANNKYNDLLTLNPLYDGYLNFEGNKVVDYESLKTNLKNEFFKILNEKKALENWIDIEIEYYSELKKIAHLKNEEEIKYSAQKLNQEFQQITELLEDYLKNNVYGKFMLNDFDRKFSPKTKYDILKFAEILGAIDLLNPKDSLLDEFQFAEDKNELEKLIKKRRIGQIANSNTLILNFNYTKIVDTHLFHKQIANYQNKIIQIHGEIGDTENNQINFGYGDEMDENYKAIENLNKNEFLTNFKSFKYAQNNNYNRLLKYIESSKFQVIILGHSCGLSDRTLLNTIFEHANCRSIKVFYYKKEKNNDNFNEIVQNISRHFNNKPLMRQKIADKSLCDPLPQDVRFKEKETTPT